MNGTRPAAPSAGRMGTKSQEQIPRPSHPNARTFFLAWRFTTPTRANAARVGGPGFAPGQRAPGASFGPRDDSVQAREPGGCRRYEKSPPSEDARQRCKDAGLKGLPKWARRRGEAARLGRSPGTWPRIGGMPRQISALSPSCISRIRWRRRHIGPHKRRRCGEQTANCR